MIVPEPSSIPRKDIDRLLEALDVNFVRLAECLVSAGHHLTFKALDAPALHHTLEGDGWLQVDGQEPIKLRPNTLVMVPPGHSFTFTGPGQPPRHQFDAPSSSLDAEGLQKFVVGNSPPRLHLICGYFRAGYGLGINPFATPGPVLVEQFEDQLLPATLLQGALAELAANEAGAHTVTGLLLKQLLITLVRRSMASGQAWGQRFSALGDVRIARAFSEMVSRPGAPHTIASLAQHAALSRSAFQARFTSLFGTSPMHALRQLRMKKALALLAGGALSIEQISHMVGYASRSSFIRAYREVFGHNPGADSPASVSRNPAALP